MNIFLFTYFFPYTKAEPFLANEFPFLIKHADSLSVLSTYGRDCEKNPELTNGLNYSGSVFESVGNKKEIFIRGIFNLAPFHFHVFEFFQKMLFLHPKKMYWFFISLLITRAALSSPAFKKMLSEIKKAPRPVLYFYWGDNLTWTLPYIIRKIKNKNIQIVLRLHNSDLYETIKNDYAPLRAKIFSLAHCITTISEHGRKYLEIKYPYIKNKLLVSKLGVPDNGLNPETGAEDFIVVSVSNVVVLKRVHLIYRALLATNRKVIWHHFGEGPLLAILKEEIKSAGNNLRVIIHGHLKGQDLMDFYRHNHIDLFINVSSSEGIPVSVMEALSFGVPVIATKVGGVPELVNEHVGALIDPDFRIEDLSTLLEAFMNKPAKELRGMRKTARLIFKNKVYAGKNYALFYKFLLNRVDFGI